MRAVCVHRPCLSVRQDVYVGFDVLAGAAALDKDCVEGPTQLATTFTDWDYHQADKTAASSKKRVFPPRRVHADTSFGSEFGDDHESGC